MSAGDFLGLTIVCIVLSGIMFQVGLMAIGGAVSIVAVLMITCALVVRVEHKQHGPGL